MKNLPDYLIIKILNELLRFYKLGYASCYLERFLGRALLVSRDFKKDVLAKLRYPTLNASQDSKLIARLNGIGVKVDVVYNLVGSYVDNPMTTIKGLNAVLFSQEEEIKPALRRVKKMYYDISDLKMMSYLISLAGCADDLRRLCIQHTSDGGNLDIDDLCNALHSYKGALLYDSSFYTEITSLGSISKISQLKSLHLKNITVNDESSILGLVRNLPPQLEELLFDSIGVRTSFDYINQVFDALVSVNDRIGLRKLTILDPTCLYIPVSFSKIVALLNINKTITAIDYNTHEEDFPIDRFHIKNQSLITWECDSNLDYSIWEAPSAMEFFGFDTGFFGRDLDTIRNLHFANIDKFQVNVVVEETIPFVAELVALNPPNMKWLTFECRGLEEDYDFDLSLVIEALGKNNSLTQLYVHDCLFDEGDAKEFLSLKHPTIKHLIIETRQPTNPMNFEDELAESTLSRFMSYPSDQNFEFDIDVNDYVNFLSRLLERNKYLIELNFMILNNLNQAPLLPASIQRFSEAVKSNNHTIRYIFYNPSISQLLLDHDIFPRLQK